MSIVKLYLYEKRKIIISILTCNILMILLLVVNSIPNQEILYAVGLQVFVLLLLLAADITKWREKYILINKMVNQQVTDNIVSELKRNENKTALDTEYNKLICHIIEENIKERNEVMVHQRDMQEYYSMWVHQIKTPIAALRLLLESENDEGKNTEKIGELFRIEQYVDMALQYVRLDSEDTDFVFEENEVEPILRGAVRKYARLFIGKKLKLNFEPTTAKVLTDAKWIGFVAEQLIANAVKYTNQGSVTIKVQENENDTRIIIEDTGIGIREEDLPRICEKGYTGYNGHANEHSTGIGLYLCNQILKKLGHKLIIKSTTGIGTVVEIVI